MWNWDIYDEDSYEWFCLQLQTKFNTLVIVTIVEVSGVLTVVAMSLILTDNYYNFFGYKNIFRIKREFIW